MKFLAFGVISLNLCFAAHEGWQLGPFTRLSDEPILSASPESLFYCPVLQEHVQWEKKHTFNPTAVVKEGKVYLIYRAEDGYGQGIGKHISRLGIAVSMDGIHFTRYPTPILFPDLDEQHAHEFPGGCEDPRIVETEDGTYIMTYTQWNRKTASLAIASSSDLFTWKKHGYAFQTDPFQTRVWSKSGAIVCKQENDRLVACKIDGKYWMYWGDISIYAATSEDLIHWTVLRDSYGQLVTVLNPRLDLFDSDLVEPGPAAILTSQGIVLLYNGRNSMQSGDLRLMGKVYSCGQVLFDAKKPTSVIGRSKEPFLQPETTYERKGQYKAGAVFIQGLVPFQGKWFLYYGAADTKIGVVVAPM